MCKPLFANNLGIMKMAQMSISLPAELKQFAEKKGKGGDYSTPSDYIRSLIRKDKEEAWARLETMLIEGLKSGESIVDSKESRECLRKEARRRLDEYKSSMPAKNQV